MDFKKLAPPLAAVYERYEQQGRRRSPLARNARTLGLVSVRERAKPLRVVVSLICDPDVALDEGLADYGLGDDLVVNAGGRAVRTAIVSLDALEALASHPAVRRIVPSTRLRPCLNRALEKVHVQQFRTRTGASGEGVVIGVVDTGIDPDHPAFAGRIERIWDQTILGGNGVPEGRYGAEFRLSQTGAGTPGTLSRDVEGHGTHVAGIAAGSNGVAPGARLVIVKTDFQDAHIIDGVQYVFRVARDLGLPAVVNLSLGGHSDAHDGSDAMSRAIEEESGPGRIVCCAAGNEGDDDIHARIQVPEGAVRAVPCHPGMRAGRPDVFAINGWYGGGDRFEIAMATPSGITTPFQPVHTSGNTAAEFDLSEGLVQIVTPGPSPDNGDVNFFVQVDPAPPGPGAPRASWRLLVRGGSVTDGTVDMWMLGDPEARPQPQFSGPNVHDALKIGSPGAAAAAVTVAASTTRTEWKDIDGIAAEAPWLELGDIASFSSEGPLRDGTRKPDITAPGAIIISALSRDARDLPRKLITGPREVGMQGTSMACPFIAGIAALVLQRDATCDPDGFKELLKSNASVPGSGSGTFHPKWGHGLLDATDL
ncbi:S8 family serine peptidase [Streptomyces sp. RerS4]|uniref:S8 family serine peptidase n=1 Tax=Streptomyces sp. RerS4 TaxID=2942449 RepID=UPI00201CA493|nr:S8 family serine peptidase [Streptomyces sp. RerS4]UQX04397.1 S8 family serine peptidase [Streptomyces sp. RerS4]